MSTQPMMMEANHIEIPAPSPVSYGAIEEACGVLQVSVSALNVVQNVLAKEEKTHFSTINHWHESLDKIRSEFAEFLREFHHRLEESQQIALKEEKLTISEYNALLSTTITDSIEKVLYVSKRAIMLVYSLDEMMTSLASIDQYVGEIKNIADSTPKCNRIAGSWL